MRTFLLSLGFLGCLGCLGCLTATALGQRPRTSDPLPRFSRMLASSDARVRWQAVHGLIGLGAAAVPTLMGLLAVEDKKKSPAPGVELAAVALARMKGAAVSAIPKLIELVRRGQEERWMLAIRVLGHVGPYDPQRLVKVREVIAGRLANESMSLTSWSRIAPALARLETDPARVETTELLRRLRRRDATRRIQAAQWLADVVTPEKRGTLVEQLRLTLREGQPRHTEFVCEFQKSAFRRVAQTHRDEVVRQELALVLLRLQEDLPIAAWVALSTHPDPALRQRSALALGASDDGEAVPALVEALNDDDKIVVWDAITALGMLGKKAATARSALESIANGEDRGKAARAKAALKRMGD